MTLPRTDGMTISLVPEAIKAAYCPDDFIADALDRALKDMLTGMRKVLMEEYKGCSGGLIKITLSARTIHLDTGPESWSWGFQR